jgi:hypothetical protein
VKNSTSDLLIENCDEFIFYEDLVRVQQRPLPVISGAPEKLQECFSLLVDSVIALQRENKEVLWGSMVKETMKRKKPSFNETYYGFRTFSHLLEDAQRRGIVTLRRDQRSGSYIVEDLGPGSSVSMKTDHPAPAPVVPLHGMASPTPPALPPASASATAASAAEPSTESPAAEANGGRPSRRRRGRGRGRARGASVLAAGAYIDPHAPPGADDDEDDDDSTEESAGEEREVAPEPEPASAPPPTAAAPAAERPFSIFSWLRRDPPVEASAPSAPAQERKPEE